MILPNVQQALPTTTAGSVKVCVVDRDFEDYQALLSERELRDVRWEFLSSGREALRHSQDSSIALWIVNTRLPDMSGLDLCQMLKAQSPTAVVYMTPDEYSALEERAAWLAGATLFRPKPIDPAWFESLAARRLRKKAV